MCTIILDSYKIRCRKSGFPIEKEFCQLERMKEYVVNQIEIMTPREFLKFTEMISGDFEVEKTISLSELFTCTDCKEKFGECYIEENGLEECYQRYEKYCIEKV